MTNTRPDLEDDLRSLRLLYTAENFFEFTERMANKKAAEVIDKMTVLELTSKKQRTIQRRLTAAHLGHFKHIEHFDWNWPESIDRPQVERLQTLGFIDNVENIILIGAQGLGKTMIAKNLAWLTVQRGMTALFTPISKMVTELETAGHLLEAKLRKFTKPDVLVLDEMGYLAFQNRAADLIYEVLSRRHENRPTIVSTNLAFKDWPEVFPGAACVVALVDRLVHKAEIVQIKGNSYRQMEAERRQKISKGAIK